MMRRSGFVSSKVMGVCLPPIVNGYLGSGGQQPQPAQRARLCHIIRQNGVLGIPAAEVIGWECQ